MSTEGKRKKAEHKQEKHPKKEGEKRQKKLFVKMRQQLDQLNHKKTKKKQNKSISVVMDFVVKKR